ncbi:MAG: hypothetical protein AB7O69_11780 [Burkholderiales bacterium]
MVLTGSQNRKRSFIMLKHKFSPLIIAGLLFAAGAVQAAPVFPSAAEEGSEHSVNAPLPEKTNAVAITADDNTFPSAAIEGSEESLAERHALSAGRNIMLAMGPDSPYPSGNGD